MLLDGMSAPNQTSSLNKSDRSSATDDPMGGEKHATDEPMGDACPTGALDPKVEYAYLSLTCHE